MDKIRLLKAEWEYDPNSRLAPAGGFASVFVGKSTKQELVAVKRLNLSARDAAYREMDIVNEISQHDLKYVIPILDSGKDANSDHYFVVMPKAEKSLQQELNNRSSFNQSESIDILLNIGKGLTEVKTIVHRDLKPGNILYHEDRWKIADFGIARFVEETTSIGTLKDYFSQPYAAPEQWRLEHATSATDIYALGCIAYALLTGKPPFQGPEREDYKKQHLQEQPLPLRDEIDPRLRSLISTMLRKPPNARPSIERVIQVLNDLSTSGSKQIERTGFKNLALAGAKDAEAAIRADTLQAQAEQMARDRQELANTALHVLQEVVDGLGKCVGDRVPTAQITSNNAYLLKIQMGSALSTVEVMNGMRPIAKGAFTKSSWDVVVGAIINVFQQERKPYVWSANLWYTDLGYGKEYRWWEIPYMTNPIHRYGPATQPFAITMDKIAEADAAAANVISDRQFAAKPRPIDDESVDDFYDRWADLIAKAYRGELTTPSHLPFD